MWACENRFTMSFSPSFNTKNDMLSQCITVLVSKVLLLVDSTTTTTKKENKNNNNKSKQQWMLAGTQHSFYHHSPPMNWFIVWILCRWIVSLSVIKPKIYAIARMPSHFMSDFKVFFCYLGRFEIYIDEIIILISILSRFHFPLSHSPIHSLTLTHS